MRSPHAELTAWVRCSSNGCPAPRFSLVYSCAASGRTDQIREGVTVGGWGGNRKEKRFFFLPPGTLSAVGNTSGWIFATASRLLGVTVPTWWEGSVSLAGQTVLHCLQLKREKERKKKNCTASPTLVEPPVASLLPSCSLKDLAWADYANC